MTGVLMKSGTRATLKGSHILTACHGRRGRGQMMLEEDVILVRRAAEASEDVTFHEVVHIGAESINNLENNPRQKLLSSRIAPRMLSRSH